MPLPAHLKLNLNQWIKANAKHLKPPVSNKQLFKGVSDDVVLFVSGGPNTRNDFHVNPTEELFYQLKGDIAVRVRPLNGEKPYDVIIKEGELFLLPRWVPHRPQRPAGTVGLIAEFPRGFDEHGNPQMDGLQWYCPVCDTLVYFPRFVLKEIDKDLAVVMNDFWDGPVQRRTCKNCGHVIQRAETIAVKGGKVRPAGAYSNGKARKGKPSTNGKHKPAAAKKAARR